MIKLTPTYEEFKMYGKLPKLFERVEKLEEEAEQNYYKNLNKKKDTILLGGNTYFDEEDFKNKMAKSCFEDWELGVIKKCLEYGRHKLSEHHNSGLHKARVKIKDIERILGKIK
jgi:hypothetical protein